MHAPSLRSVAIRPAGGVVTPLRLVTVGLLAFAAACLAMTPARAVSIQWSTIVSSTGNANDTTG